MPLKCRLCEHKVDNVDNAVNDCPLSLNEQHEWVEAQPFIGGGLLGDMTGPTLYEVINNNEVQPSKLLKIALDINMTNDIKYRIAKIAFQRNAVLDKKIQSMVFDGILSSDQIIDYLRNKDNPDINPDNYVEESVGLAILLLFRNQPIQLNSRIIMKMIESENTDFNIEEHFSDLLSNLARKEKRTLYITLAEKGLLNLIKLIELTGDRVKITALQQAAYHGKLNVVEYLVENGFDFHSNNELAIYNACTTIYENQGHIEVVKYLLGHGADIRIALNNHKMHNIKACTIVRFLRQYAIDYNIPELTQLLSNLRQPC